VTAGERVVTDGADRLRDGAKVEVITPAPRTGVAGTGAATGVAGGASAPTTDQPAWMSRLPPDLVEKVKAMNPEERRAFLQKLRERRQQEGK
jgi:multidrug efflux system membrane fusion protein